MSHWRLGSRFLPTTAGAPVINLPPSGTAGGGSHAAGGTSGLGLGTVAVSGLSTPFAGVPEPSTYLLCGVVLVLGGCWYARRRGKKPPTSTEAVDLRTLALGETGESLSSIASATR
jgi:hypothetical protein